jgi:uncharacterized membrane protein
MLPTPDLLAHATACLSCDPDLRATVLGHRFWLLVATVAPVPLVGGFAVAWLARALARRGAPNAGGADRGVVPWAATLLGLGLGGFVDGIVLHQILQVHAMISNSLPPDTLLAKSANMVWDGVFHAATWILTLAGIVSLWRACRRRDAVASGRVFWGGLVLGWGALNVLDGLIHHWLLRYHDLVEASAVPWAWNLGFVLVGLVQVAIGAWLMRRGLRVDRRAPA